MNPIEAFENEKRANIALMAADKQLKELTREWMAATAPYKFSYNFSWMGRPIIQFPEDIIALQEIIWKVRPEVIIETGIAHGGSLVFHASMLELLGEGGQVVGVDIDIRQHNRQAIESHPMCKRIQLIQGSSTDPGIVDQVCALTKGRQPVMVILDSNHTHDHVLQELNCYSHLVTQGSYLVVLDTLIEDMPGKFFLDRPWGPGNNPKTAVWEFLKTNDRFEIDKEFENKLLATVAPDGYLRCTKD